MNWYTFFDVVAWILVAIFGGGTLLIMTLFDPDDFSYKTSWRIIDSMWFAVFAIAYLIARL